MTLGLPYWVWVTEHWSWPLVITLALVVLAASLSIYGNLKTKQPTGAIQTSLRLQFHPGSITPTCLHIENVFSWYALCHIFNVIEAPSKQHKEGRELTSRQWTIFLVFDKPVAIKQIIFDTHGAQLPHIEVKDRGPRHAVILIGGDVGGAVLDIKVVI